MNDLSEIAIVSIVFFLGGGGGEGKKNLERILQFRTECFFSIFSFFNFKLRCTCPDIPT